MWFSAMFEKWLKLKSELIAYLALHEAEISRKELDESLSGVSIDPDTKQRRKTN